MEEIRGYLSEQALLIYDEADWWLLDSGLELPKTKPMIGFSATTLKHQISAEAEYLKAREVFVVNGYMKQPENLLDYIDEADSIEEWVGEKLRRSKSQCGFLLYVADRDKNTTIDVLFKAGIVDVLVNCEEAELIGNVARRALIVTSAEPLLMRGVNYRSQLPIHLLIACSLSSTRGYLQAQGRVKRFSDRGSRALLKGVAKVDTDAEVTAQGQLFKQCLELKDRKAAEKRKNAKVAKQAKVPKVQELSDMEEAKGDEQPSMD